MWPQQTKTNNDSIIEKNKFVYGPKSISILSNNVADYDIFFCVSIIKLTAQQINNYSKNSRFKKNRLYVWEILGYNYISRDRVFL